MAQLLSKGKGFQPGYVTIASPKQSDLRWLEFGRLGLVAGTPFEGQTGDQEVVYDIMGGVCRLQVIGGETYESLGGRRDPFSGGPTFICLPPQTSYRLEAVTSTVDLTLSMMPSEPGMPVAIVRPDDAPTQHPGAGNWSRKIWPGTSVVPATRRLMMAETLVPPGNWTSYPPHKHDVENPPNESIYEEVYFYRFSPSNGYGFQRVYETTGAPDALNEVYTVEDGDAVAIPRGYHPLVTAAGYQLLYIWALCGQNRVYGSWSDDPAHAWIRGAEPMVKS
jgi:5-deoxy-glucuronate isomerase